MITMGMASDMAPTIPQLLAGSHCDHGEVIFNLEPCTQQDKYR
jgi:hypothetical protein